MSKYTIGSAWFYSSKKEESYFDDGWNFIFIILSYDKTKNNSQYEYKDLKSGEISYFSETSWIDKNSIPLGNLGKVLYL